MPGSNDSKSSDQKSDPSEVNEEQDLIELLQPLPEPQRKKVIYALQQRIAVHQGPILHPDILAGYQSIDPEFAHKIVEMGKREHQHRHNQDRKTVQPTAELVETAEVILSAEAKN